MVEDYLIDVAVGMRDIPHRQLHSGQVFMNHSTV